METKLKDIYWVAGLLEGEGCFLFSKTPIISINMTDLDTIQRLHKILKCTSKISIKEEDNRKTAYTATLSGHRAVGWMFTLYLIMSKRRQEKIKEVIDEWKSSTKQQKTHMNNIQTINGAKVCAIHGPLTGSNVYYTGRYSYCKSCYRPAKVG